MNSMNSINVNPKLWHDDKFNNLDTIDRLVAFYMLTSKQSKCEQANFSPAMAAEEIGITTKKFESSYAKVRDLLPGLSQHVVDDPLPQ